jgi:hypothetical protein
MNLQPAPPQYSRDDQQALRREASRADRENFKKLQDVRLENGERLILKSPNGTLYAVVVSNAGVLSTVAA